MKKFKCVITGRVEEIEDIYNQPMMELVFRAAIGTPGK